MPSRRNPDPQTQEVCASPATETFGAVPIPRYLQDLVPFPDALALSRAPLLHARHEDAHVVPPSQAQPSALGLHKVHDPGVGAVPVGGSRGQPSSDTPGTAQGVTGPVTPTLCWSSFPSPPALPRRLSQTNPSLCAARAAGLVWGLRLLAPSTASSRSAGKESGSRGRRALRRCPGSARGSDSETRRSPEPPQCPELPRPQLSSLTRAPSVVHNRAGHRVPV